MQVRNIFACNRRQLKLSFVLISVASAIITILSSSNEGLADGSIFDTEQIANDVSAWFQDRLLPEPLDETRIVQDNPYVIYFTVNQRTVKFRGRGVFPRKVLVDIGASSMNIHANKSDPVICLCHHSWHGIRAATLNQDCTIIVEVEGCGDHLAEAIMFLMKFVGSNKFVVNGVPPGSVNMTHHMKKVDPSIMIYFIYHGSTSQHTEEEIEARVVHDLFEQSKLGIVRKIGFVKEGFAEFASSLGMPSAQLWNKAGPPPVKRSIKLRTLDGHLHIGIFGWTWLTRKNVATQLAAACIFGRKAVVHMLRKPGLSYASFCEAKFVYHGVLARQEYLQLIGMMDVMLYLSLDECFAMTVIESLQQGTVVLSGNYNPIFELEPRLKELLVVNEVGSPHHIAAAMRRAIANEQQIITMADSLLPYVALKAHNSFEKFIDRDTPTLHPYIPAYDQPGGHFSPQPLRPQANLLGTRTPVVLFCTYELGPVTQGGAGVVVSGLVEELLANMFKVHVLADLTSLQMNTWKDYLTAQGVPLANLKTHILASIHPLNETVTNEFVRKSLQWKDAVVKVVHQHNIDLVEFHEYAGTAFFTLLNKLDCVGGKLSGPCINRGTNIALRTHGSLELIDLAESLYADETRTVMHVMERAGMELADALIFQSTYMKDLYSQAYGFDDKFTYHAVIHPPMNRILRPIKAVHVSPQFINVLILGRLQKVKGTELALEAAVNFLSLNPTLPTMFFFIGSDSATGRSYRSFLSSLIPPGMRNRITFGPPINRMDLSMFLQRMKVGLAVVPSYFETFSMVAHELCKANIPLIMSEIPAFKGFFHNTSVFFFRPGDASSLSKVLGAALLDREVKICSTMKYTNTVKEYRLLSYTLGGRAPSDRSNVLRQAQRARSFVDDCLKPTQQQSLS